LSTASSAHSKHLVVVGYVDVTRHAEVGYLHDETGVDETVSGGEVSVDVVFRFQVDHPASDLRRYVAQIALHR